MLFLKYNYSSIARKERGEFFLHYIIFFPILKKRSRDANNNEEIMELFRNYYNIYCLSFQFILI